jgi:hypothetical protein
LVTQLSQSSWATAPLHKVQRGPPLIVYSGLRVVRNGYGVMLRPHAGQLISRVDDKRLATRQKIVDQSD